MFKKIFMVGISIFMVLTLGACGNADFPEKTDADSESAVLIAYFSWSGNTRQLAEVIQEQTGCVHGSF